MPHALTPLDLNNITLCAIDCVNPILALRALDISSSQCRFGEVIFLSDSAAQYQLPGCRMEVIPRLESRAAYSQFVLKELGAYLRTSHLLLIQWDGYVIHPEAWRQEFLDYDYIGAPWGFYQDKHRIGNGGFSLRSRRLFEALRDTEITDLDPEDEAIGRTYRLLLEERYAIRFPLEDVAGAFSFETTYPKGETFGFHGLFNMWMVIPAPELVEFVATLSAQSVGGQQFLRLGQNYLELGRREEAKLVLERRLEVLPNDPGTQRLLAQIASSQAKTGTRSVGRNDPCPCDSGKRYKQCCGALGQSNTVAASVTNPANKSTEALLRSAMARHQAGQLDQAEIIYRQVIDRNPKNTIAQQYLGVLKMQRGDPVGGEVMIREALAVQPDNPDFHNNLGLCLRMQGRLDAAIDAYRQALAINPEYAAAHNNLGLDLQAMGHCVDAVAHYEIAIRQQPQFAEAHWNLGLAYLLLGDMRRGWTEYEWRLRCQPFSSDGLTLDNVELWQGQALGGKTLLVRQEQGAGDTLQFLRFVPELVQRGAHVLLDVPHDLSSLAQSLKTGITIIDRRVPLARIDYTINLMSLPHRLGVTLDTLPARFPYLRPDENLVAQWQERLKSFPGQRIGLVWGGSPNHVNDHNRSCPLKTLQPLFQIPGLRWFSLQKGKSVEQLSSVPSGTLIDLSPDLKSYSDTAAALQAIDLLITVDTSVAHLAGALNRPVWVLLPYAPDWRWLLEKSASPWYPSMRLFRQKRIGDWDEVCAQLKTALVENVMKRQGQIRHRLDDAF
jgi:tetratricopeptide (TPR) repeat protein